MCNEVIMYDVLKKVFYIDVEIGWDLRINKLMCIMYNLLRGDN